MMKPTYDLERLFVAIVLSCLLHVAVGLLFYTGGGGGSQGTAIQATQQPDPKRTLSFKLVPATRTFALPARRIADKKSTVVDVLAARRANKAPEQELEQTVGPGLLPSPHYYTAEQLTKRPQAINEVELDVPAIRPVVASGKSILKLWIDEQGVVISVETEATELPQAIVESAEQAFKHVHFEPGEISGRPVRSIMRLEINYEDSRLGAP